MANPVAHINHNRPRLVSNDNIGLATINSNAVDQSVDRVFIKRPLMTVIGVKDMNGAIEILYFEKEQRPLAYHCWLGCSKGVLAAMRNANDRTPVYHHDFVDQH